MQTANGLLILKLIDCVAAGSDLDGDEGYQEFRRKVGEFVVENRVPSQPEFAKLTSEADAIIAQFTDEAPARAEIPEEHIAPAGLKGDVLRTAGPATSGGRVQSAFRDPFALENQPEGDAQAEARRASAEGEKAVAYVDGQNAKTPSQITAEGNGNQTGTGDVDPAAGESAVVQNDATDDDADDDNDDNDADDDAEAGEGEDDGDNADANADAEPDFKAGTKADLTAWLDSLETPVTYETDANKARLVELAQGAWDAGNRPKKTASE